MTEPIVVATTRVSKLSIQRRVFYRILYFIEDVLTHVTIFEVTEEPENPKELNITEIRPQDIPDDLKSDIFDEKYEVLLTKDDRELVETALKAKRRYYHKLTREKMNVGTKRQLLRFIEVGGHYFGWVYEHNMPYLKLYQLLIEPVEREVMVERVPEFFWQPLVEAMADTIFPRQQQIQLQVGDGVYIHLAKWRESSKKATATIIGTKTDQNGETGLTVIGAFFVVQHKDGSWHVYPPEQAPKKKMETEVKKGFEFVYQDLSLVLFGVTGEHPNKKTKNKKRRS